MSSSTDGISYDEYTAIDKIVTQLGRKIGCDNENASDIIDALQDIARMLTRIVENLEKKNA